MKKHNPTTYWRWLLVIVLVTANSTFAALVNRYSFNEAPGSTSVSDSVGAANGAIKMTTAVGGAPVSFDGAQATLDGIAGYIDLPNGLVSVHTNITLEMWVTWTSGGTWARIFDFGTNVNGEDINGTVAMGDGGYYLFATPNAGGTTMPRFAASDTQPGYNRENPVLNSGTAFPFSTEAHLVVTYGTNGARLFINGQQVAAGSVDIPLSTIRDANVWLGRANYPDPMFGGSFNEFRVHNNILTLQEIVASGAGGPDTISSYDPGAATSLDLVLSSSMTVGGSQVPQLTASFANINGGTPFTVYGSDVTITSSAPNIVSVGQLGNLTAQAAGTATIVARLGSMVDSVMVTVTPGVATLVHRYSFNEANGSTTAADSVGGASFNGTVVPPIGAVSPVVISNGQANFPGGAYQTAGYVDLPDNMLSQNKTNVSIEFWFTWNGGAAWQRVFDFGNSLKGTDPHLAGDGLGYLMFTPVRGGGGARTEFRTEAPHASVFNDGPAAPGFPVGQETHVVVVAAPGIGLTRLYINGIPVATGGIPQSGTPAAPWQLSQMVNPNNWLGMAQWNDPPLNGRINEFRIHEGVLTDINVALSRSAGPNALPVNPGNMLSTSLQVPALMVGNPNGSQAAFLANFQNVSGVDISGLADVTYRSTDTNLFTVSARGVVTPRTNVGSAQLIAIYPGYSATSAVHVLAPVSLSLSVPANIYKEGANVTLPLLATFPGSSTNSLTNINVSAFANVTRSSATPSVGTITAAGVFTPNAIGSTIITSAYNGVTNQTPVNVTASPGYIAPTIAHRYGFNEAVDATQAQDSVGGANGTVVNLGAGTPGVNNFNGTGQLVLLGSGNSVTPGSAYVNLPNGLVSSRTSMTIEGWVTWNGAADSSWQRILDFGMSSGLEDPIGSGNFTEDQVANPGRAYMFITPRSGNNTYRFAIKQGTDAEAPTLDAGAPFTVGAETHFAVVYDYPAGVVRVYRNGARAGTAAATLPLSVVDDRNVWLGRAQWGDPMYNGSYNEFRIYNGVMFDADIAASFAAGPNAVIATRPALNIGLSGANVVISWSTNATGFTLEASATVNSGYSSSGLPPATIAGDKFQVTVPAGPNNRFFRLGQ